MELHFGFVLILLSFQNIASSPMNYVYYENPDLGYVAALSGAPAYTKTRPYGPKKFFVGNTNQKYMKLANEDAINSLFNVSRLSPKMFDPVIDTNNVHIPKIPEDDNRQTKLSEINNQELRFIETDQSKKSRDDDINYQNSKFRMAPDNIREVQKPHFEGKPTNPKSYFEYRLKQNKRKANFNAVPKLQYDFNPPPVKKTQLPAQKYDEKPLNYPNNDMTYKKNDKVNYVQAMTTILDDMTQKALNRYELKLDNKKTETQSTANIYPQPAINQQFGRDNRVKFLDSKRIPSQIGKYEESLSGRPYALFYRGLENANNRDFYTEFVDKSVDKSGSLHSNVVESKMLVKDVTLDREKKRKARKISNIKLNRNSLDTSLI